LTGLIGLSILFFRRKRIAESQFRLFDWFAVLCSLFWLREVFNLTISIASSILRQDGKYFGGDEANISRMLELPEFVIPIALGFIGLVICLFVIFKVVPKNQQATFILSGLVGGSVGFVLWMEFLGPIVLP